MTPSFPTRRSSDLILAAGHEIVAHSTDMNGTIASGLPEAEERALIAASLDMIERVIGTRPRGWMSIARRWEAHPSELQSLMRSSYDVFCLKKTLASS